MTDPFAPIPTSFATVGPLQGQTRQLFNAWPGPGDAIVNERSVGFCPAGRRLYGRRQDEHHLAPQLLKCERHSVIVLQANYDNQLRAVKTALRRGASF